MNAEGLYRDRREAGRILARLLQSQNLGADPLILALPRGGVPVAAEVADALHAPLGVFLVRKLGVPGHPEVAMGAIASGGVQVLDESLISETGLSEADVASVVRRETQELRRREDAYQPEGSPEIAPHPVVVVDDGLATGFTMRAAVTALRRVGCPRITVAVPVGPKPICHELAREVDLLVCPMQPEDFVAVGLCFEDFSPTSDAEVRACLARFSTSKPASSAKRPG
jgi:putative phosphoribosyl transferase